MTRTLTNTQILLKEGIKQEYQDSQSYTNESSFFEFFAASQVLKNYYLSDEEIENHVMGDGNDGGCDAVFLFLNSELVTADQLSSLTASKGSILNFVIIQSKNTTSFGEDAIMKWKTASCNMMDMSNNLDDFSNRYNENVREIFKLFRTAVTKFIRSQVKIHIQYHYVTLGNEIHKNVCEQADELCAIVKDMYPSANVEVNFIGAEKLMELYNTDSEVSINLELSDQPITLGRNTEYVALINLGIYYRFITDDNQNLRKGFFESNVRDYQGKNVVNTSIAKTLLDDLSEDFWWLNNGITILSEKVTPITNRELVLLNPEIVNGLQTSTEIFNYFSNNPSFLEDEKRNLLVRIIVPTSEESRDRIIFATNNQTNIPKSSLRVTDPIHLQIEMYFKNRGLYYDRRKNYYKNQGKKSNDIISVSFLAQCIISIILHKPDFARARPSTILADDQTYKFLYEENQNLDAYFKIAFLGRKIQLHLKKSDCLKSTEVNDILFYLIYAVVAKTLNKKEIYFSDFKDFQIDSITVEFIDELQVLIYDKYNELGGNGQVAKNPNFINEVDNLLNLA